MTRSTGLWLTRLAVATTLWPGIAAAQTTARSFEELKRVVKVNQMVIVTDTTGRTVKGALAAIDHDSLSLATGGRSLTFARPEVSSVRATDNLTNGALIGAGAGLAGALGVLAILGSGEGYVLESAKVGAPLLLSGVGTLVGALVDRAHDGRTVLYAAPSKTGLSFSPVLGKSRQGLLVSVSF